MFFKKESSIEMESSLYTDLWSKNQEEEQENLEAKICELEANYMTETIVSTIRIFIKKSCCLRNALRLVCLTRSCKQMTNMIISIASYRI